jgi:MFS family permease
VNAAGSAAAPGIHRPGGLLWHRDFRLLWFGETVSQLGTAMAVVAMPLAAVTVLHAGTFAVTALVAMTWLPWLLIGLPAGAWVDRLPRRAVMVACDLIAVALYASVPLAALAGVLTIGQLLAVGLLGGAAGVLFTTAYQAYLPSLLPGSSWSRETRRCRAARRRPGSAGRDWRASWRRPSASARRCSSTRRAFSCPACA